MKFSDFSIIKKYISFLTFKVIFNILLKSLIHSIFLEIKKKLLLFFYKFVLAFDVEKSSGIATTGSDDNMKRVHDISTKLLLKLQILL